LPAFGREKIPKGGTIPPLWKKGVRGDFQKNMSPLL